ncbi:GntR family transcriptional regulator [Collinsella sp. zg1085]|uniref:GntR family transcriptional regulator n=1 Tax=Collinsella sp. zg1085 TaxID=2844380 RepID=UPI001C0CAEC5|nr:GntR family transcriptional regulator [Collinsella sp. zg1085]QWT17560.1 GntR family transcriptional regulator [Collinsella sp. zg1085]
MSRSSEAMPPTLQEQLRAYLETAIIQGIYQPGDKLPSENELIREFQISRVTVRAALSQLVADGLVIKRQGKGAFVKQRPYRETSYGSGSFTEACLQMQLQPQTRILNIERIHMDSEYVSLLNADNSAEIIQLERLRLIDDTPCIVELDFFPRDAEYLLHTSLEDRSLLRAITEETGVIPAQFTDQFYTTWASTHQAEVLQIKKGTSLLKVEQSVCDQQGKLIYINHQFIFTERYVYSVQR